MPLKTVRCLTSGPRRETPFPGENERPIEVGASAAPPRFSVFRTLLENCRRWNCSLLGGTFGAAYCGMHYRKSHKVRSALADFE